MSFAPLECVINRKSASHDSFLDMIWVSFCLSLLQLVFFYILSPKNKQKAQKKLRQKKDIVLRWYRL